MCSPGVVLPHLQTGHMQLCLPRDVPNGLVLREWLVACLSVTKWGRQKRRRSRDIEDYLYSSSSDRESEHTARHRYIARSSDFETSFSRRSGDRRKIYIWRGLWGREIIGLWLASAVTPKSWITSNQGWTTGMRGHFIRSRWHTPHGLCCAQGQ